MSDIKLRGTRTVLWLALLATFLGLAVLPPACFATDVEVTLFGPKQYLQTPGNPQAYSDTFSGMACQGKLIVTNGDAEGDNRVSSALIVFDGQQVFGPSTLNQQVYTLEAPVSVAAGNSLSVVLASAPRSQSSSLMRRTEQPSSPRGHLTVQVVLEMTPDATTTQVVGTSGGTVSVKNHLGDTFTLTIPPLALDRDTSISVSALPSAPPNPIAQNLYPGVVLAPPGLEFGLPVSVDITPHNPVANPGVASLYWIEDSGHVLPIANQTSAHGEIFHFSPPIAWGAPSCDDMGARLWWWKGEPTRTPQNIIDDYYGVTSLMQTAWNLGCPPPVINALLDESISIAVESGDVLQAEPAEPFPEFMLCGPYNILMNRWADVVSAALASITGSTTVDKTDIGWLKNDYQEIIARKCKFSLSPPSLNLQVGETSQTGITATLRMRDSTRSCAVLDWYNSNPNAVAIAPSGMACVPSGVRLGVANVSANCEGLDSSNQTVVTVCSLSGTWTGPYSGDTFSCAARAANGVCSQIGPPKSISGPVSVPFTQTGTTVSAVIVGISITGTNVNGTVDLGPVMVPCNAGTSTCPAGISGTLAPDCSSFSGYFYEDRTRTRTGTFTLYPPAAQ
jgi:hypothetical protein